MAWDLLDKRGRDVSWSSFVSRLRIWRPKLKMKTKPRSDDEPGQEGACVSRGVCREVGSCIPGAVETTPRLLSL